MVVLENFETVEVDGLRVALQRPNSRTQSGTPSQRPSSQQADQAAQAGDSPALGRRSSRPARRDPPPIVGRDDSTVRRKAVHPKAGKRRVRRWENGTFLRALARRLEQQARSADGEDASLRGEDLDYTLSHADKMTYVSSKSTAFKPLFQNDDLMQTWQSFEALSLSEQSLVSARKSPTNVPLHVETAPERCFLRIDPAIRSVLKRQNIPETLFLRIEDKILQALERWDADLCSMVETSSSDDDNDFDAQSSMSTPPEKQHTMASGATKNKNRQRQEQQHHSGSDDSDLDLSSTNYRLVIPEASFGRMLAHGIAQYMGLSSQSFNTGRAGTRVAVVWQPLSRPQARPSLKLSELLGIQA